MSFLLYLLFTLFILVCILLILMVLIQKGRGGGLASAFGGGGGNTAFGSKTGDVLTWATSVLFGVFLLLGVALNLVATKYNELRTAPSAAALSGPGSPNAPTGPIAPSQGGNTSLPQPLPAEPGIPSPNPTSPNAGKVPPVGVPAPAPVPATPAPAAPATPAPAAPAAPPPAAPAAPAPSPTTPTPSK
jgi:preprotein translocase subunit SecG